MNAKELGQQFVNAQPYLAGSNGDYHTDYLNGMNLRQYCAVLIFQQFMAGAVLPPEFDASEQLAFAAKRSCEAADALLVELAKDQP